ncbi:MAG: DUF3638 domain-containing protein [Simkaniaceae bacterium]|nr:MAG: DUF3638 domain-containing protein [Simkaniaceae bacterium]
MQMTLVSMVQKAGGLINYELNRAKRVFSFNPNIKRLQDLFQKYFPEGLFPETEAITRLKTRLTELSFASEEARHEFMGNEEALLEMSLLHEERDHIPVSPEVFRAILHKRQRDQEAFFDDVLDYSIAVSRREENFRIDEIIAQAEQGAALLDKEARALEQESIALDDTDRRVEAAEKRLEALGKRTESEEIRRRAVERREQETAFRRGQAETEEHPAVRGETELREAAARALKDAQGVRELITEGASKALESEEMPQFVGDTAEYLSALLGNTPKGEHFVYMGKAGTSSVGVSGVVNVPGLEDHIPPEIKTLLSEKDPKVIGRMAKANVIRKMGPMIMEFLGEETVRRLTEEHQLANPVDGNDPVALDPVALFEKWIGKSFERLEGVFNEQMPEQLTAEIVHSLREDAREVLCGVRTETGSEERGIEKLFDKIAGQGFEEVLERAVGESLVSIRALFTEKMDDVVQVVTQFLPSSAHAALTSLGLIPNIEKPFWIDIIENSDGTFTVKLFANGLSAEAFEEVQIDEKTGLQVPLVFENVVAEKLTPEFFHLLVDYEYRPKYKEGLHSFSVEHVVSGLTQYLGTPKVASDISEIVPHRVVEDRGPLSLMYLYLFSHQGRDISSFHAEHSFDLSLHAFVDYWKEFGTFDGLKKSRELRSEMRIAIDHISKEAILLHNDEVISNHKLQQVYATLWEIEREMHRAEEHRVKERNGGIIIPPGMQDHLKALLLASGADPSYLEVLKEAFLAAAGDDCEEIFDAALNELLPELVTSSAVKEAEVLDWQDIFKIETVKKKIEYIKMNRLSILQLVKFYAKMMVILFSVYRVTLSAKTIATTIEKYYPNLKEKLPFSPFYLGMAMTLFGPQVFAKTLPKDVYESVAAIYHLSTQVSWYVFNRLLMHGFKQVLKKVIKEEDKNSIRTLAKQMQQEVLRKGELGYKVAPSQGNHDAVALNPIQGPVLAVFADHEVTPLFEDAVPKPEAVKITAENYAETLDGWIEHVRTLRDRFGAEEHYDLIYLNEQIRNLPIPDAHNSRDNVWGCVSVEAAALFEQADALLESSPVESSRLKAQAEALIQAEIPVVIEKLHLLLVSLYEASQNTQKNPQHRTETVISFYSLYAIIDSFAKRSNNSGLDASHMANGEDLFHFTQKVGLKVTHEKSLQQLRAVCGYFDFELGERLTPEEVRLKFATAHFNYAGEPRSEISKSTMVAALPVALLSWEIVALGVIGEGLYRTTQTGKAFNSKGDAITVTPYQQYFSVENAYFRELLQRPEIQERLRAHGVDDRASSMDKQLMLFRDPPMLDAPHTSKATLRDSTSEHDPRKGILPREYYILRAAHFMCSSRAIFDTGLEETFLRDDPIRRGLSIPKVEVPEVIPTSIFGRIKAFASKAYHTVTLGAFQAQLLRGNLAILAKQDERLEAIRDRTIGRSVHGTGIEHTVGASQREQTRYQEETFGVKRVDQTSVIEAIQTVDEMSLLTVEEKRILDMVQSYDKDRLIRALGIFSYRKDRLRHPEFRVLFDLLCQNLVALEAQAKERVEIGRYVGEFFVNTIDHFKGTGDLETALFMTRMGIELEGFFISHDKTIKPYFPDFAWEIRECIIPAYQALPEKQRVINVGETGKMSGIHLALTTLAVSYMNVDLRALGDEARSQALADIGRFAFYQGRQHPEFQAQGLFREAKGVVFKWANQLKEYCDFESDLDGTKLRDELLDQLFADAGIDLGENLGAWEGNFPVFRNVEKGLEVNLSRKTIYGHASVFLREKGEEELRRIFGKEDLGQWQFRGNNTFEYPALEIAIQWHPIQRRFMISKVIEEEIATYCSQEEITINWGFSPFAFEARDLIFVNQSKIFVYRDGELIARFTRSVDGATVTKREHVIGGEWHQAVDLSQQKHGLTLLNWFVKLDDIEAYSQPQPAVDGNPARDRLTYVKLKPLNLEFKIVEKEDGTLQAISMSEGTRGYVLCKRQEDARLYSYPHAIILRNEAGAEKVILKSLPFATVFLKFVVNNVAKTKTSPMIDELINTQAVEGYNKHVFGELDRELAGHNDIGAQALRTVIDGGYRRVGWDKAQYFTTNFDEDGELSSKDPNMMTYLAYYHFCSGDIETAKHYFDRLETFGNQYPFTEDALNYIDRLVLLLGYSPEPLATELALRLAAIREKNYLVQMPTDSEKAPVEGEEVAVTESGKKLDRLQIMRALVLQEKYVRYLEDLKFGGRQYLTPEDELFIFKTLTRAAKEIFDAKSWGLDEDWQGVLGRFQGDYTSEVLMPPTLVRRLHYLRAKYNEPGIWKSRQNRFLFEAFWYDRTNPYTRFLGEPKRKGFFGQVNSIVKGAVQSPLSKPQTVDYAMELSTPTFTLEDLPLSPIAMEPRFLLSEFVHYYALASNQMPPEWKDSPEKVELFQLKRAEFMKSFPLLKGNFPPKYALFYDLLDRVSKGVSSWTSTKFFGEFPTADRIRIELLAVQAGEVAVREAVGLQAVVEEAELRRLNAPCVQEGDVAVRKAALENAKRRVGSGAALRAEGAWAALQERLEAIRDGRHFVSISYGEECRRDGKKPSMFMNPSERVLYNPYSREIGHIQELLSRRDLGAKEPFNEMMQRFVNKSRVMLGMTTVGKAVTLENAWGVTKKVGFFTMGLFGLIGRPTKFVLQRVLTPGFVGIEERLARGISRVWKQEHDVMMESEAPRQEPEKVSVELAQVLGQREHLITTAMRELLEEYCTVLTTANPAREEVPVFNFEGLDDEAIRQGFEEFNNALAEYYRREPGVVHTFTLREGRSIEEFIHAIRRLKQEVTAVLEKEQKAIVDFVNQEKLTSDDAVERTLSRLEKTKVRNKPLTFNDILQWFLTEDNAILLNRSETSKEHIPLIKEKVYLYLMTLSRFNILFEKVNSATTEEGIAPLASELLRERTYQVRADEPERLLKTKVAYEARTGKMLWEVQASHLDRIILQGSSNLMNVMIMGDGKSSAVIPGSDYAAADGRDALVVNVWPKSVKGQSLEMMDQNAHGVYGQGVNAFVVDRRRNWDSERLWALAKVFTGALKKREQINVTQEDLQSLLLRFLDEGLDLDEKFRVEKAEYDKRIDLYKEVLLALRTQGIGNIDEIHEAAREDKELNFPLGKRKTLKLEYAECLEEVMLQLVSTPEVAQYVMIKDREPKRLEASVFEERVAPIIAAKLVALRRFEIPMEDREAIAAYLCGQSETIPECAIRHPQFKQIALMRGALMIVIPKTLERIIHKHFHLASSDTGVEYVKPSEGNVNTVDEADFLSPFETFCKTACLYLRDRLSDAQVLKMIDYLKTKAENEAKKRGIAFELTDTAINFKTVLCPGVNLSDLGEEVSAEIIEQLRGSDALTLAYVRNYIRAEIKYYPTILESNGQDLINMFAKIRTHTGTPEPELLPDGTRIIAREGILGQSVHTFETRTKGDPRVFTKSDPVEVLETDVIQGFFNQSTSNMNFIDRGATVNGLTTQEVATRIWAGIQGVRTEIKGVVFYLNATAMILTEAGIRPLSESRIQPHEYVTYFDEPHTYAADVKGKKTGEVVSLLTIGETTTFEKEADQAEYRDRGIESEGHSQIVAMTRHVRDKVIDGDRNPNIREVTTFLRTNGRTAKKKRKFFIDSQKLEGLVKQAVIQKALEAESAGATCEILRAFEELLVSTVSDNPIELFGLLRVTEDRKVVLKAIRDRLLKKLSDKGVFSKEEILQLNAKLAAVIEGDRFKLAVEMYETVKTRIRAEFIDGNDAHNRRILSRFAPFLDIDIQITVAAFFDSEEALEENPLTIIQNRVLQPIHNEHFTEVQYEEMVGVLTAIARRETPPVAEERVHAFQSTEGLSVEVLESMGRTVQVQAVAEAEDEEQEQEIDNVNNLAQAGLEDLHRVAPDTDISWSEWLTPTNLGQWFKMIEPESYRFPLGSSWRGYTPPLFELRKGLKLSSDDAVRDFADTLPPSICCSWNMFKVFTSSFRSRIVEPFGPRQKPIFEFLVVQDGLVQKIILLDQKEVDFWRRKLEEDRNGKHDISADVTDSLILDPLAESVSYRRRENRDGEIDKRGRVKLALVDNISGAIVATGRNEMTERNIDTHVMNRARAILKLASGYTNFSGAELEILETWMTHRGVDRVMNFFEPTAYRMHKKEDFDRSNLQALFFKLKDRVREPEVIRV